MNIRRLSQVCLRELLQIGSIRKCAIGVRMVFWVDASCFLWIAGFGASFNGAKWLYED